MREFDFCESQKHLNPVTMDFEAKPRARDYKGIAKSSSGGRFDRRRGNLSPGGSASYWFWEDLKTGRGALTSCLSDLGRNFGRRSFSWDTRRSSGGEGFSRPEARGGIRHSSSPWPTRLGFEESSPTEAPPQFALIGRFVGYFQQPQLGEVRTKSYAQVVRDSFCASVSSAEMSR